MQYKLAVAIGNSRLHFALFQDSHLEISWDTAHLQEPISVETIQSLIPVEYRPRFNKLKPKIVLASVVPSQTVYWLHYPQLKQVFLTEIPLRDLYPTMGIDRALAIYGAGEYYGYPCLVIDGGTALTFTGVDQERTLVGGAILPGLRSQIRALSQQTSALPEIILPNSLPPLWAKDTTTAIACGIIHTLTTGVAHYIAQWQREYPTSSIILTGGDGKTLLRYLQQSNLETAQAIKCDRSLIFRGIQYLYITKELS